ncbi:MAG: hypothetical protein WCX17_01085 [Parcubacteria group bacterium]|jgi:hypothetical protein
MKSLRPDDVKKLIKKISEYIEEKTSKLSRSAIKLLRGIIGELERLLKVAKRKLKKVPSLAATYKIDIPMHHEYHLSNHKIM